MPTATRDGVELRYRREGEGPTVAFVPTAGYGPWQWAWQSPAVAGGFEALVYAQRGTGESSGGDVGDVSTLVADLEAVLADAGVRSVHLVGFGLGGAVALEHARRHGRARTLTLIGTPLGSPDAPAPHDLVDRLAAPRDDPAALRESLDDALSPSFREANPDVVDGIVEWRREEDAAMDAWRAQATAFEAYERDWPPYEVTLPTLVAHGGADAVVPVENARRLADGLPEAELAVFEGAGHLVTVERSRPLNDRLVGFLEEHVDRE